MKARFQKFFDNFYDPLQVISEVSPRKRNREMTPILDPLEPLEKISRLEHLTSSIGGSRIESTNGADKTVHSADLSFKPMKTEIPSSSSSPVLKRQSTEVQSVLPAVQVVAPLADKSEAPKNLTSETIEIEKTEVQTKDNSSSSEDFSSSEDNEDKNENIKVFKNGVEMTTWHCDVCKCIFLDQVSKTTYMKIQ